MSGAEEMTYFLSIWFQSNPNQSKSIQSTPNTRLCVVFFESSLILKQARNSNAADAWFDSIRFECDAIEFPTTCLCDVLPFRFVVIHCCFVVQQVVVMFCFAFLLRNTQQSNYPCFRHCGWLPHTPPNTDALTNTFAFTHICTYTQADLTHIVASSIRIWRSWSWLPPRPAPFRLAALGMKPDSLVNQWTHLICLPGCQLRQPPIVAFYFVICSIIAAFARIQTH